MKQEIAKLQALISDKQKK